MQGENKAHRDAHDVPSDMGGDQAGDDREGRIVENAEQGRKDVEKRRVAGDIHQQHEGQRADEIAAGEQHRPVKPVGQPAVADHADQAE